MRTFRHRSLRGLTLVAIVLSAGVMAAEGQAPQATFRTGVDLIAVDVQVVTENGLPLAGLAPDQFTVRIDGRPRRVVSADFVRYDVQGDVAELTAAAPDRPTTAATPSLRAPGGRVFIIAIDTFSFRPTATKPLMEAAEQFLDVLHPSDLVGVFAYPGGPRTHVNPTTSRATVRQALQRVTGTRDPWIGDLTPTELIDCSGFTPLVSDTGQVPRTDCSEAPARSELAVTVLRYEAQAQEGFAMLRSMLAGLADSPGRKTIVLLSAGIVEADVAGGRPDFGDMGVLIGQEAARANAVVYTLFVDHAQRDLVTASSRRRPSVSDDFTRDRSIMQRWLGRSSGMSGGGFFSVISGGGEYAFSRILDESSAYYLLGVEPADTDRDGRPRELTVSVAQRGATIRGRQFVVVPRK
jgi:VWFA-related protein